MSRINGVIGGVVRPVVRGLTSNKGVGAFRWIDGVYAQRVIDDEQPLLRLIDDETGSRIYEAINHV